MSVKSWEDLEDRVERTILKLEVSLDSTNTPIEVSKYVYSELPTLHNLRIKAKGTEKVRWTKNHIYILDVYTSYIIALKDSKLDQDRKIYQNSCIELFNRIKPELNSVKNDFEQATGEAKVGLGDCLIDAYLLYLKLAKACWQKPSPEYHSIFLEVITAIDIIKKQSFEFLSKLYESTNGNPDLESDISGIVRDLKLDKNSIDNVLDYLRNRRLIEQKSRDGEKVSITPEGIYVINNVINVSGDMVSSQIQQDSPGATQVVTIGEEKYVELKKVIQSLKESIDKLSLQPQQRSELEAEIITIETQMSSPKPKSTIIAECLKSIRNILEGAASGIIVSGLLNKITSLLAG